MFWVPNEEKNVGYSLDEILKYFKASKIKLNWFHDLHNHFSQLFVKKFVLFPKLLSNQIVQLFK